MILQLTGNQLKSKVKKLFLRFRKALNEVGVTQVGQGLDLRRHLRLANVDELREPFKNVLAEFVR